jgi:hypothetical protein
MKGKHQAQVARTARDRVTEVEAKLAEVAAERDELRRRVDGLERAAVSARVHAGTIDQQRREEVLAVRAEASDVLLRIRSALDDLDEMYDEVEIPVPAESPTMLAHMAELFPRWFAALAARINRDARRHLESNVARHVAVANALHDTEHYRGKNYVDLQKVAAAMGTPRASRLFPPEIKPRAATARLGERTLREVVEEIRSEPKRRAWLKREPGSRSENSDDSAEGVD